MIRFHSMLPLYTIPIIHSPSTAPTLSNSSSNRSGAVSQSEIRPVGPADALLPTPGPHRSIGLPACELWLASRPDEDGVMFQQIAVGLGSHFRSSSAAR